MPIIASLSRRRTQTFERTTLFSAYSGVQNGEVYSRLKRRPSSRTRKTRVMARMKIDATIKAYFRQGVKLFYDTGETRTMKETFERTLVLFFHQGWESRNGVCTAPIRLDTNFAILSECWSAELAAPSIGFQTRRE